MLIMGMTGVSHQIVMRHFSNYGIHHPFNLTNMSEKNIGFVNENVSPQSMFSYNSLKETNPRTKNVTESCYCFDEISSITLKMVQTLMDIFRLKSISNISEEEILQTSHSNLRSWNHVMNSSVTLRFIFLHVRRGDNVGRESLLSDDDL